MSEKKKDNSGIKKVFFVSAAVIFSLLLIYVVVTKIKFGLLGYFWIVAGLVLFIVELATPAFFAFPFGVGCIFAAFANLLKVSFLAQLFVFIGVSAIAWIILPYFISERKEKAGTNLNGEGIIGSEAVVTSEINPPMKGRVYVMGNTWSAIADKPCQKGKKVIIESLEGITVFVKEKEE